MYAAVRAQVLARIRTSTHKINNSRITNEIVETNYKCKHFVAVLLILQRLCDYRYISNCDTIPTIQHSSLMLSMTKAANFENKISDASN